MTDKLIFEEEGISFSNLEKNELKFMEENKLKELEEKNKEIFRTTIKNTYEANSMLFENLFDLIDESEDPELSMKIIDSL